MRIFFIVVLSIAGLLYALVPAEDKSEASGVAKEIYAMFTERHAIAPYKEAPIDRMMPGQHIYTSSGERLGTIMALTKRGNEVTKVWSYSAEFEGNEIEIIDGRVVVGDIQEASINVKAPLDALP